MENALVPVTGYVCKDAEVSLNPCFNGKCTRTDVVRAAHERGMNSLNPCFNGKCTRTGQAFIKVVVNMFGLNPCFNGKCTRTPRLSRRSNHSKS